MSAVKQMSYGFKVKHFVFLSYLSICTAYGNFVYLDCDPCRCRERGLDILVNCSKLELYEVPDSIPLNATHIDLSHNNIREFYNGNLHNLKGLRELDLSNNGLIFLMDEFRAVNLTTLHLNDNQITYIDIGAFRKLRKLKVLKLENNMLDKIHTELRSLPSLNRLDISSNSITEINIYAFRKMTALKYLDLSNNKITSLDPNHLVSCGELETFKVDNNELFGLPDIQIFRRNYKLKEVTLANNSILVLSSLEFSDSSNLEVIDVSNNNINFLWPNSKKLYLKEPRKLKYLDLSRNRLLNLPLETLYELSAEATIAIYNNSLICEPAFLERLTSYITSTKNHIINPQLIRCNKPDNLKGQIIGKFECPVGAKFNICAKKPEPKCDEMHDAISTNKCISRCECPDDKPITYNRKCESVHICNSFDIGDCYKERATKLYKRSVGTYSARYIPQCDENGYFRPLQCLQPANICWCTDSQGKTRCPLFHGTDKDTDDTCSQDTFSRELTPHEYLIIKSECYTPNVLPPPQMPKYDITHKMCSFWGNGRVRTFDGAQFQISADCYYGLVNDLSLKPRYHVYARFTKCNGSFCIPSILLYINRAYPIHIMSDFYVSVHGRVMQLEENKRLSFLNNTLVIIRDKTRIRIISEYLEITYSSLNYLIIRMNTDRMSNMIGSCGTTSGLRNLEEGYYAMFDEWKLMDSCKSSKLLSNERDTKYSGTSKCQTLKSFHGVPSVELGRILDVCETDRKQVGEQRVYCASLAMSQNLQRIYQEVDNLNLDSTMEGECL